jgi:hypothetical protein
MFIGVYRILQVTAPHFEDIFGTRSDVLVMAGIFKELEAGQT